MYYRMKPYVGVYPSPATSTPTIWGPDFKTFLPPVFAVYFEPQQRFVIYETKVADIYHVIRPYESDRSEPFYLHTTGNPATHPLEVYSVKKAQHPFCIWFQHAWLCRKNGTSMSPTFPVMRITQQGHLCKYSKYHSVTVYERPNAVEWVERFKTIDSWLNRLAVEIATEIPHEYEPVVRTILKSVPVIHPLPPRIAKLLLEEAVRKEEVCSITLDPLTLDTGVVTSCFHFFDKHAIQTWLDSNKACPVCKQECVI